MDQRIYRTLMYPNDFGPMTFYPTPLLLSLPCVHAALESSVLHLFAVFLSHVTMLERSSCSSGPVCLAAPRSHFRSYWIHTIYMFTIHLHFCLLHVWLFWKRKPSSAVLLGSFSLIWIERKRVSYVQIEKVLWGEFIILDYINEGDLTSQLKYKNPDEIKTHTATKQLCLPFIVTQ